MSETVSRYMADFSVYVVVLPLIIGSLRLALLTRPQNRLLVFIIVSVCVEFLARIIGGSIGGSSNNLPLLHLYTWVQFVLIANIYRDHIAIILSRSQAIAIMSFFTVFVVVNAVWIDGLFDFNPHARALESIVIIMLVLSYFFRLLREMQVGHLEKDPLFWTSTALLIYFSGALLIFIVSEYISNSQEVMLTMWGIHAILNIVANLLYAVALWVKPKRLP